MITQCISAAGTLGVIVLAILVIVRAVSLDDALESVGKLLVLILVAALAGCLLRPLLLAGGGALNYILRAALLGLVVTVVVVAPVTLVFIMLFSGLQRRTLERSTPKRERH